MFQLNAGRHAQVLTQRLINLRRAAQLAVEAVTGNMRRGDAATRRAAFDGLRKHYPMRREIDGLKVCVKGDAPALVSLVQALGVKLKA